MEMLSTNLSCNDVEIGIRLIPVRHSQYKLFNLKQDWGTPD